MKRTLFASSLLLVGVLAMGAGCNNNTAATNTSQVPAANSSSTSNTNRAAATNTAPTTAPAVKEFDITASQFAFSPSSLTVNAGDTVKLHVTSDDTTHGFSLPQFGVNKTVPAGETVEIEFIADEAGTYTFSCSVACGSGHAGMKGTLVVQ
jgi:cytochrome c oxidase subunit 2